MDALVAIEPVTHTRKYPKTVDPLLLKLLAGNILDKLPVSDRQKSPSAIRSRSRNSCTSIFKDGSILGNQAIEDFRS